MNRSEIIKSIDDLFPCDLYCNKSNMGSFRTFKELRSKDPIMYNEIIDYIKYDQNYMPYSFKTYTKTVI